MTRLVDDVLQNLRKLVLRMGGLAEAILQKSLDAVARRDGELVEEVARDDLAIDRLDVEIDDAVLKALALQAPVAEDLREVIAIKMIATDLERVGDIARNIAKCARRLGEHSPVSPPPEFASLSRDAQGILRKALDAFGQSDVAAARAVLALDDGIDDQQDEIVRRLVEDMPNRPDESSQAVDLIFIAKNLERVADHATNIAEDVILVVEARNVKHASKLGG